MWNQLILGDLEEDPQVHLEVLLDEDPITDKDKIKDIGNKLKLLGHFLLQKLYVKTTMLQDWQMIMPMITMTIMAVVMITDLPLLEITGLLPIMEMCRPYILLPVEEVPLPVVVVSL